MTHRPVVAALGAGRMGRGIAQVFAYAGHRVQLLDAKPRPVEDYRRLAAAALAEIRASLEALAAAGLFDTAAMAIDAIVARVEPLPHDRAEALRDAEIVFECVPEVLTAKHDTYALIEPLLNDAALLASTTSTLLVDELAAALRRPQRFLNAHWLNPAYLIPLVELSPGEQTDPTITQRLITLLEGIGKIPVVCAASPGYIVPRIQALAMNEAARMAEQGVASAEDIDKAIRYGFGFRFAVLGLLEFTDWGGGDILYYASDYLRKALNDERHAPAEVVVRNMRDGKLGLRSGQGFYDYDALDVDAYRRAKLTELVRLLRHVGAARPPVV